MNNKPSPTDTDPFQDDLFFAKLQATWDEHSRRVEAIASQHEDELLKINFEGYKSPRRRLVAMHLVLVLVNTAVAAWSLVAFLPNDYSLIRITGHVLAATCAVMAGLSLANLSWLHPGHRAPVLGRRAHHPLGFTFFTFAEILTSARQIATISVTTMAILVSVSYIHVGDGHAMTATGHANRTAIIMNVNKTIASL